MNIYKLIPLCYTAFLCLLFPACRQTNDANTDLINDTLQGRKGQETSDSHIQENTVTLTPAQFNALSINLGTFQKKPLSSVIQVTGKVAVPPQSIASITFPYGGSIRSAQLQEGSVVSKGDLLATLENPEFIQLQQEYLECRSQLTFLKKEYERQQMLSEQNINAEKSLEKAKAEFISTQGRLKGLKAKLSMININMASLENGEIQLSVPVFGSLSGVVSQVNINKGSYVSPGDIMYRIINSENMYIELSVFEKDISKIHLGQTFKYSMTGTTTIYEGTIVLVGREILSGQSILVHGKIPQKDMHALTAGRFVTAVINTAVTEVDALPEEAIVDYQDKKYLFLQMNLPRDGSTLSNRSFRMVEVQVGMSESGFIAVTLPQEFVGKSDSIVLKGAFGLLSVLKNSPEE